MRRPALFLVSLACLATLFGGAGYANSHETLTQADLKRIFHDVNRESFGGKLPEVPVVWGDLTKDDAYGVTHFDKEIPYSMEIDRQSVVSESFARDVIRHESCHIVTIHEAKRLHEDQHGASFGACMEKIQASVTGD
jgi:predicted SprT family Zn-dependent metalloprotease